MKIILGKEKEKVGEKEESKKGDLNRILEWQKDEYTVDINRVVDKCGDNNTCDK